MNGLNAKLKSMSRVLTEYLFLRPLGQTQMEGRRCGILSSTVRVVVIVEWVQCGGKSVLVFHDYLLMTYHDECNGPRVTNVENRQFLKAHKDNCLEDVENIC